MKSSSVSVASSIWGSKAATVARAVARSRGAGSRPRSPPRRPRPARARTRAAPRRRSRPRAARGRLAQQPGTPSATATSAQARPLTAWPCTLVSRPISARGCGGTGARRPRARARCRRGRRAARRSRPGARPTRSESAPPWPAPVAARRAGPGAHPVRDRRGAPAAPREPADPAGHRLYAGRWPSTKSTASPTVSIRAASSSGILIPYESSSSITSS